MILTSDQIINLIKENDYKLAKVYQGHLPINDLKNAPLFERIEGSESTVLIKRVEEIKNLFGGNFTICLGKGHEINMRSMAKVNVSFTQEPHSTQMNNLPQEFTHIDKATIIAEAKAEFKLEMIAQQKEDEIKEMRKELENLKTWGGKASLMFDNILKMYFTPENLNNIMQGTKHQPKQEQTDLTTLEQALSQLIEVLSEDTIIKLAAKLQTESGKSMLPMIKNFVN